MDCARTSSPDVRSSFRFTLRDLLVLMLLIGVGLGWWSDHRRMQSRLELAELRILHLRTDEQRYRSLQQDTLRLQLAESELPGNETLPEIQPPPFATADGLLTFVRTGPRLSPSPHGQTFIRFASQLWRARGNSVVAEAIPELTDLLAHRDEQVRARAAWALGALADPQPALVAGLIPLLDDPSPTVQWHAASALGEFKAASEAAIPALEARMLDDDCQTAAFAAVCITRIDPRRTSGQRLAQLVSNKHPPNRKQAVQQIPYHLPHDEVAQLLTTAFASERDREVRDAIAITLNRLRE